jgi:hypothetical protein
VIFEFTRNKPAVKVRRLCPISTARGANSTRIFEIDEKLPLFLVPGHLVRVGRIPVVRLQGPSLRRGRSGAAVPGKDRFEISAATKARILELCRCFE